MKKSFILLIAVALLGMGVNAQVLSRSGVGNANNHKIVGNKHIPFIVTNQVSTPKSIDTIAEFPYLLDFENGMDGWNAIDQDGDGFNWSINNSLEAYSGSNSLMSESYNNDYGAFTPDNWFISPAISIPEEGEYNLKWMVSAQDPNYAEEHYAVYISTEGNDIANFTSEAFSETIPAYTEGYYAQSVSLADYAGQTIYVAFRHYDVTDMFAMKIDDICIKMAGIPEIQLNIPTLAFAGDTVMATVQVIEGLRPIEYEWTINADYELSENSDTAYIVFEGNIIDTISVIATNEIGSDTASKSIQIMDCNAPIEDYPYAEVFDNPATCWHGEGWEIGVFYVGETPVTASLSVDDIEAEYPTHIVVDNSLYSPYFTVPTDTLYELQYLVCLGGGQDYPGDHYTLEAITENDTILIYEETLTEAGLQARNISLADLAGETVMLRFRHFNNEATSFALCLGELSIHVIALPEVSIIGPDNARSTESVTFQAVASCALDMNYEWNFQGATPETVTDTNIATVAWTGAQDGNYIVTLTVSTEIGDVVAYDTIYITNCDNGLTTPFAESFDRSLGCWTTMDADGDGLNWMDAESAFYELDYETGYGPQYAHSGDNALVSLSGYPWLGTFYWIEYDLGEALTTNNYLVSPEINVTEGASTLSFYMYSLSTATPESFEIRIKTGEAPTSPADFTTVLHPLAPVTNGTYTQYGVDLSAYAGQTIYLAFIHKTTGGKMLILDDIAVNNATVGIDMAQMAEVSVYPSVTADVVNVLAENVKMVEVLDLNGRIVMAQPQAGTLNISNLSQGIYFIRVVTSEGTSTQKVIKR